MGLPFTVIVDTSAEVFIKDCSDSSKFYAVDYKNKRYWDLPTELSGYSNCVQWKYWQITVLGESSVVVNILHELLSILPALHYYKECISYFCDVKNLSSIFVKAFLSGSVGKEACDHLQRIMRSSL